MLKGAPFARLESRTYDGLTIEPLYARDAAATAVAGRAPGAAWTVMQRVDHPDPAAANAQALDDLQNGATGLVLVFAGSVSANGFGLDPSPATLRARSTASISTPVAIDLNLSPATRARRSAISPRWSKAAASRRRRSICAPASIRSAALPRPAAGRGAGTTLAPDFAAMVGELAAAGFRGPFAVADGRVIHNAGGSEAQELAFALASAVAYLRALEAQRHGARCRARRDLFPPVGRCRPVPDHGEIPRARENCGRGSSRPAALTPKPAIVAAETAWRMMTKRDPYVNMLRTTIAVVAAGFGGADAITVLPHTAPLGLPDPFARRVARNTQLILLEESNLANVGDPAAGSGALEAMTHALCTAAWSLFQEIEKAGGVWAALENGLIQRQVAAVRAEREHAVARRTDILTGTSEFPEHRRDPARGARHRAGGAAERRRGGQRSGAAAHPPRRAVRTAARRLGPNSGGNRRAAESLPRHSRQARRFQGPRHLRQEFLRGRRHRGGQRRTTTPPPLAAAFKASGAALACLCSSDKVYESEGASAAGALAAAGARHIYLAGPAGEREAAFEPACRPSSTSVATCWRRCRRRIRFWPAEAHRRARAPPRTFAAG